MKNLSSAIFNQLFNQPIIQLFNQLIRLHLLVSQSSGVFEDQHAAQRTFNLLLPSLSSLSKINQLLNSN